MHLCYTVKGLRAVRQARLDSHIGNYLSTTHLSSQEVGTYLSACKHLFCVLVVVPLTSFV